MAGRLIRLAVVLALIAGSLGAVGHFAPRRCTTPVLSLADLNASIDQPVQPFIQNQITANRQKVDPATEAGMRALLDQMIACSNAGEPLRVWSLYTPTYLGRLFQIQGQFESDLYEAYAKPLPDESGSGMALVSIEDVWSAGGGLFGVEAILRYPSVPMPKRLQFWIVDSPAGLRIEEIVGEISFSLP